MCSATRLTSQSSSITDRLLPKFSGNAIAVALMAFGTLHLTAPSVLAQAPQIEKVMSSVKFAPNAPFEYKCHTNAINIPQGSKNPTFKFQFEKKVNGKWENAGDLITVITGTHKGNAQADTGWVRIDPAKGEPWRTKMECHYIDPNNIKMVIPVLYSNILTPKP